jgi:hypothetical protein
MRLLLPALAASLILAGPAQATTLLAQRRCFQVVDWIAPDLLRCKQVGTDYLGIPVWLCC